eukprot:TRINITY_DN62543_c0_g1_i1.p1 TRINITY_DN62543_c0_g1~~TRINITY_DN62543_c0_g1_i1.p1  ORF type:complete len:696 (-),score=73.30 TRINITY_DN62543_c0_g1_i1:97-2184(-)
MRVLLLLVSVSLAFRDQSSHLSTTDAGRAHRQKQSNDVLVGTWDVDSSPWKKYPVKVTPLEAPTFLTGHDKHSQHFLAESPNFRHSKQGSQGSRVLTVRFVTFSAEQNATEGYLEERLDFFHPVHDYGRLKLERRNQQMYWVIDWAEHSGHRHSWLRIAGNVSDVGGHGHGQSEDEASQKIAGELLNEWDRHCSKKLSIADASPLRFYLNFGAALAFGVSFVTTSDVAMCVEFSWTQLREERLKCIIEEMKSYSVVAESSKGSFVESAIYHRVSQLLEKALKPSMSSCCAPQVCLVFTFAIAPVPPFVWPVPTIGLEFLWPSHDIWTCGDQLNTTTELQEAFSAHPQDEATKHVSEGMRSSALAFEREQLMQGVSFTLFPPAVGWVIDTSADVVINGRKLLQGLRRAKDLVSSFGRRAQSECDAKRESYFRSLSAFAKAAHEIYAGKGSGDDKCGLVRSRLDSLKSQLPGLDFDTSPLEYVQHLRQLSDPRYNQEQTRRYYLGGGWVYAGSDGLQIGYYLDPEKLSSSGRKRYHNDCKAFKEMVHIYQSSLSHAEHDLMTDERCSLEPTLPSLKYNSCRSSTQAEGFKSLPKFPEVLVSADGDVISATDSQCTRCANITSFGFPCEYCSSRSSCFRHSTTAMCFGRLLRSNVSEFDRPTDPRILCARRGGQLSVAEVDSSTHAKLRTWPSIQKSL